MAWGSGRSAWNPEALVSSGTGRGPRPPAAQSVPRGYGPPDRCFRRVPPEPPGHNKACTPPLFPEGLRLAPLYFCKNIKGSDTLESRQGRGDSGALRGTTRHWSFQGSGEGRRPFASLCGNPLVAPNKARFPAGASAKRAAAPAPNPSFYPKNKDKK